jgi:predicted glutamine amidotransferase
MCRILLIINRYKNNNIIKNFINQSNTKKYTPKINCLKDHDINMDGYGFGWYNKSRWNIKNGWNIYKSHINYFNDSNNINFLHGKNIIIGHLRAVMNNSEKPSYNNTHPFMYNNSIWVHNGTININKKNIETKGTTDSEYMHKYFVNMLNKNKYQYNIKILNNMIISFFKKLKELDTANIIYGDNKYIWVSRYYKGKDTEPLSLYYDNSNGIVISSEPVTKNYKVFPKNMVIIYNHNGEIVNKINLN